MSKNLVIVESPAKAKTIEGYLGKDYKVASSYGHVRDLPDKGTGIDVENGFAPTYEISPDKKDVIKNLKKLVKEAETIFLASDDDREGEAISWHLAQALDLTDKNSRRIVFREITKRAIDNAIQTPRGINIDLVNAQQARRVLDRLVGYEISPILWKKIKTGLSAGRVQSVAVRLIVERERDIEKFNSASSFKITAEFIVEGNKILEAELNEKPKTESEVNTFLERCTSSDFQISDLQKKPAKKSPAPPFTTSTLQQEASRKLGFSVSQTMTVAQRLYESGKISYMRTDSVNLSQDAINAAKQEIETEFGKEYSNPRVYKTKSNTAQEAHEAIRPTNFSLKSAGEDRNGQRLYELIWKRAVASQMSDAQLERTSVKIDISDYQSESKPPYFNATGEIIKFDGFLKLYIESKEDDDEDEDQKGILPPLSVGQVLNLNEITCKETFTRPPARYTEATLVKKLEEMGIGRPSTYAPTISTIQKRNYVIKESREGKQRDYRLLTLKEGNITANTHQETTGTEKNKLFPTDIGMVVNDFLVDHFPRIVDFHFTADVEREFDEIAQGQKTWNDMLGSFYGDFHDVVEDTEQIDRSEINKPKELGVDPETGRNVYARLGKFGPIAQIGEQDDEEKPKYASLRKGQLIETITLEEALDLFKLPREIGEFEDEPMVVGIGKYGPYIRHQGKFVSLEQDDDPYSIESDRAIELIKAKRQAEANRLIKTFEEDADVQVLNGRYGPYIKFGKKNVKIPKGKEPKELTYEEVKELAEKAPEKKGRRGARR